MNEMKDWEWRVLSGSGPYKNVSTALAGAEVSNQLVLSKIGLSEKKILPVCEALQGVDRLMSGTSSKIRRYYGKPSQEDHIILCIKVYNGKLSRCLIQSIYHFGGGPNLLAWLNHDVWWGSSSSFIIMIFLCNMAKNRQIIRIHLNVRVHYFGSLG